MVVGGVEGGGGSELLKDVDVEECGGSSILFCRSVFVVCVCVFFSIVASKRRNAHAHG